MRGIWGGEQSCYAQRQRCLRARQEDMSAAADALDVRLREARAQAAATENTRDELEDDVVAMKAMIAGAQDRIEALSFSNQELQGRKDDVEQELESLDQAVQALGVQLAGNGFTGSEQREIDELEARRDALSQEVEALYDAFLSAQGVSDP